MSRRKNAGDQEFGSDSFLDIIANIVGILIILIVVAGMKVARQPLEILAERASHAVSTEVEQTAPEPVEEPVAEPQPDDVIDLSASSEQPTGEQEASVEAETVSEMLEQQQPQVSEPVEPVVPDTRPELATEIADLQRQLDAAETATHQSREQLNNALDVLTEKQEAQTERDREIAAVAQNEKDLQTKIRTLQATVTQSHDQADAFRSTLASLFDREKTVAKSLKQVAFETRHLREVLEAAEDRADSGERISHRLSPVSKPVTDAELHFRLSSGRIAHIPLESLIERISQQVRNRGNVVMKLNRYDGIAGPVGGFRIQYTVQRAAMPPLQALQYGHNPYRISLSGWTILPAETLEAEPVDAALRIGSRFRQVLEASEPDTAVTVWLYPDDFSHFAKLRELTHNLGLRIAARPLPEGTSISGSRNGSQSKSQ